MYNIHFSLIKKIKLDTASKCTYNYKNINLKFFKNLINIYNFK